MVENKPKIRLVKYYKKTQSRVHCYCECFIRLQRENNIGNSIYCNYHKIIRNIYLTTKKKNIKIKFCKILKERDLYVV